MVLRRRQLAAGVAALSLLTGCGLFGGRNSGLQGQVEMMGAQTGAQLLSGLIFTPNPDETAVQFRLPGEDYWMGATRFATWPGDEPPQPRSGRAFDQVPYVPTGMYYQPTAYRRNLAGILKGQPPLFWNVRRT